MNDPSTENDALDDAIAEALKAMLAEAEKLVNTVRDLVAKVESL